MYSSQETTERKIMSYLKIERTELLELLRDTRVFATGRTESFGSAFVELCLSAAAAASVTAFSRDEQKGRGFAAPLPGQAVAHHAGGRTRLAASPVRNARC